MCCFSTPVQSVANTKVFARRSSLSGQFLAYEMRYAAARPVAMILPLPVAPAERGRAVRFVSLEKYPRFFEDMGSGFPAPQSRFLGGGGFGGAPGGGAPLPVVEVGVFVASYVPGVDDFARLDRRFVIPRKTWERIPGYVDYGFAVFQLREARGRGRKIHPMALEFATRKPDFLFFPTVHIHDGKVHEYEDFDHVLYFQRERSASGARTASNLAPTSAGVLKGTDSYAGSLPLSQSPEAAGEFMNVPLTEGLVSGRERCGRILIGRRRLKNQDLWLPLP